MHQRSHLPSIRAFLSALVRFQTKQTHTQTCSVSDSSACSEQESRLFCTSVEATPFAQAPPCSEYPYRPASTTDTDWTEHPTSTSVCFPSLFSDFSPSLCIDSKLLALLAIGVQCLHLVFVTLLRNWQFENRGCSVAFWMKNKQNKA